MAVPIIKYINEYLTVVNLSFVIDDAIIMYRNYHVQVVNVEIDVYTHIVTFVRIIRSLYVLEQMYTNYCIHLQ